MVQLEQNFPELSSKRLLLIPPNTTPYRLDVGIVNTVAYIEKLK